MPRGPGYKGMYNDMVKERNHFKLEVNERDIEIRKLNKRKEKLIEDNTFFQKQYNEEIKRKETLADAIQDTIEKLKRQVVKQKIIIGYIETKLFGKTDVKMEKTNGNGVNLNE